MTHDRKNNQVFFYDIDLFCRRALFSILYFVEHRESYVWYVVHVDKCSRNIFKGL